MFKCYFGGSKTLDKHIEHNSEGLLLWIHGHTHYGVGLQEINLKPILNPGTLSQGRFAVVRLKLKELKWALSEVRLINLNSI